MVQNYDDSVFSLTLPSREAGEKEIHDAHQVVPFGGGSGRPLPGGEGQVRRVQGETRRNE